MFSASPWIEFIANGVLADAEVTDFGGALMATTVAGIPPLDWVLCLDTLEYGAAASGSVEVFFAPQAGSAPEDRKQVVLQTAQYFIWPSVIVPRSSSGIPYTMRITKADAGDANLGYKYSWRRAGGC